MSVIPRIVFRSTWLSDTNYKWCLYVYIVRSSHTTYIRVKTGIPRPFRADMGPLCVLGDIPRFTTAGSKTTTLVTDTMNGCRLKTANRWIKNNNISAACHYFWKQKQNIFSGVYVMGIYSSPPEEISTGAGTSICPTTVTWNDPLYITIWGWGDTAVEPSNTVLTLILTFFSGYEQATKSRRRLTCRPFGKRWNMTQANGSVPNVKTTHGRACRTVCRYENGVPLKPD